MTIKENVTTYRCDFCKKKMFVEKAMTKHEQWCNKNPKNIRACYGCLHLEEIENEYTQYYMGGYDGGDVYDRQVKTKAFKCTKLDKILYPFKVEQLKLQEKYPETFEGQEPMPIKCEHLKLW